MPNCQFGPTGEISERHQQHMPKLSGECDSQEKKALELLTLCTLEKFETVSGQVALKHAKADHINGIAVMLALLAGTS